MFTPRITTSAEVQDGAARQVAGPRPRLALGNQAVLRRRANGSAPRAEAPSSVEAALSESGRPLDPAARAFFEPRFGEDFSDVRVHTSGQAARSASDVGAEAYAVGSRLVFAEGRYAPGGAEGRNLLAHELAHVVQQRGGAPTVRRRAKNCPEKAPNPQTINSMDDFVALVRRVEKTSPTGADPIAAARLITRTKYDGSAWDWLLPTTSGKPGAVADGTVTPDDIGALCFKLIVTLPGGGMADPMHLLASIVADAETLAPGAKTPWYSLSQMVQPLPASLSQRSVSTWAGDVGKAAAEWSTVHPTKSGSDKPAYLLDNAAPHEMMVDVDGVAMTSKSAAAGFAFDKTKPLSDNLDRFFKPAAGTGRERRFHIFCDAEKFALEADGVTLSSAAKASIGQQVKDFSDWYAKNDPSILTWLATMDIYASEWIKRAGDWQWFADQFIAFVQKGLTAEGK